ncbi:retention module-containing protein, partial [Pseudoalteromonas sp. SWXJ133]|uniref:retention module-containing protein n=1 Tax=Pseudoalteromonas sp. SWXJ133 TaxID=2792069 RepID=UPI0018CED70C
MEANQLLVIDIQGSAGVVLDDGSIRALNIGDIITVGDLVVTAIKSSLQLDVQGETLSIPANQKVKITPDLLAKEARDSSETTVFDESLDEAIASLGTEQNSSTAANSDVTDFLDALEGDGDILDNLEATAAGGGNAAGAGGGSSFVQLTRISESVDPNSVTFDSSFDQSVTEAFNLRDTSDGIVPDATTASISLNEQGVTNSSQPTITGTSENLIGETVNVTVTDVDGNSQVVSVVIGPDGTFEITLPTPVADGPVTVVVEATDPVGNPINDTISIEIDTTPPLIAIDPVIDSASQTVTITGTVSGLNTGDNVSVTLTDSAGTVQTIVTQVDALGNWVITTTSPLSEGEFNVSAVAIDTAGNQAVDQAVANVDLTAPEITVTAIADTNDTTPTFLGQVEGASVGSVITVVVTDINGNVQTLTTLLNENGTWSVDATELLPSGEFTVVASVTDAAGNEASAQTNGEVTFAPISIQINSIADTNDTTPFLSGNTSNVPAGTTITLTITVSGGSTFTLLAVTQEDGSWSAQVTTPLPEGDFSVVAAVIDDSGNEAQATAVGNVDLTISINFIIDTNDTTPTVSGSTQDVEPGALVTVIFTGSDGAEETIQVITSADGSWSVEASNELAEGQFSIVATVTDAAGNTASASETGEIDLTAPVIMIDPIEDTNDITPTLSGNVSGVPAGTEVILVITDSEGNQQALTTTTNTNGTYAADITTGLSEGEFTVTATVTDAAGNEANDTVVGEIDTSAPTVTIDALTDSNDTTPTISGTATGEPAGTVVTITVTDDAGNEQIIITEVLADGTFTADVPDELSEGEYSVDVSVTDTEGNESTATATGEIDTSAPIVTIDLLLDTNDTTPAISGSVQGVPTGTTVTLTVTGANGIPQTITAQTLTDGSWTANVLNELGEGDYTVDVSVTDTAGNNGVASAAGTVDTSAPVITINTLGNTSDTTPTISGTVSGEPAGSTVTLIVTDANGVDQTVTAQVIADGSWTAEVPAALAEGNYSVVASISDSAGNEGTANTSGTIDTSTLTINIDIIGETNDQTPEINGDTFNIQVGSQVDVQITDFTGATITLTTFVDANGLWSVTPPADLAEGTVLINATVTDLGGGTATAELNAVIDITPPTIQINQLETSNDTTPVISGNATGVVSGTVISLTVTDSQGVIRLFNTTADIDGDWSLELPQALASGDFSVEAEVSDAAGNSASDTAIGNIDTAGPSLTVDFDTVTNDATPTISGTSDAEIGTSIIVVITDENGVEQTLTTTVDANGNWEVTPQVELNEGDNTVTVSASDAAGNTTTVTDTITIDTQAPTLTFQTVGDISDLTPELQGTSNEIGGTVILTITD